MILSEQTFTRMLVICGLLYTSNTARSQTVTPIQTDGKTVNNIYTSVPFLLLTPDARSGAMGEAGVAISADANAIFWNPAKLTFAENPTGVALSYTPWLRKLVPDINLSYLSFYQQLGSRNAVGFSLKHFSLGQIQLMDDNESDQGTYRPSEMAIDAIFSRKLSDHFSLGIAFRYINSNLSNGLFLDSYQLKPVTTVSGDVSAYYKKEARLLGSDAELAFGLNISNLGNKVTYQKDNIKYYLPANMKLGVATTIFNKEDHFTFAFDINKLLVPTNPERDADGRITRGKDPDRSLMSGLFGSFNDAPGGFSEELREISYSLGTEYWIRDQFALRAGYFFEDPTKGNRQYVTSGIGIKYKERINVDVAYVLASQQKTPIAQTLRFTLMFNINKKSLGDSPEQIEAKRLLDAASGAKLPEKALETPVAEKDTPRMKRAKRKAEKEAVKAKEKAELEKKKAALKKQQADQERKKATEKATVKQEKKPISKTGEAKNE